MMSPRIDAATLLQGDAQSDIAPRRTAVIGLEHLASERALLAQRHGALVGNRPLRNWLRRDGLLIRHQGWSVGRRGVLTVSRWDKDANHNPGCSKSPTHRRRPSLSIIQA
jgi:hypothetical protein